MAKKKKNPVYEQVEGEVVKLAGDYFTGKFQHRLLKFGELSVLVLLALILISFGIVELIGFYFPFLDTGFDFVILGMIFFIVSLFVKV